MKWNVHERRCAVVQILCNKGGELSNKEVAEMVMVSRQRLSELPKSLLESMDPRGVVDHAKTAPGNRRKVRSGEFEGRGERDLRNHAQPVHEGCGPGVWSQ